MEGASQTGKGWIWSISVKPTDHNVIYAGGHHGGVWKTIDAGNTWVPLTDNVPEIGGVVSMVVDYGAGASSTDVIYAATAYGEEDQWGYSNGIYKSSDGGNTWFHVNNGDLASIYNPDLSGFGLHYSPRKIIMDKFDASHNTLYMITYDKVFKTTSGGANWTRLRIYNDYYSELPEEDNFWWWGRMPQWMADKGADINCITNSIANGGCSGFTGFNAELNYYHCIRDNCTGGDINIFNSLKPLRNYEFGYYDIEIIKGATKKAIIVSGHKIYQSIDEGANWHNITKEVTAAAGLTDLHFGGDLIRIDRCETAVDNDNYPGIAYFFFAPGTESSSTSRYIVKYNIEDESFPRFMAVSSDAGKNKAECSISPTQTFTDGFGNTEPYIYITGISMNRVNMLTSSLSMNVIHADVRDLLVLPVSGQQNDEVFTGTDGGVGRATQTSLSSYSYANLSDDGTDGLHVSEFYGLAGVESNPDFLIGGLQDVGIFTYNPNGTTGNYNTNGWRHSAGGDGGKGLVINYSDPRVMFSFDFQGCGSLKESNNTGLNFNFQSSYGPLDVYAPVEIHPTNPNIIYVGCKADDNCNYLVSSNPPVYETHSKKINKIVADFTSYDASTNITIPGNNNTITALGVSQSDPNVLYVANQYVQWGGTPSLYTNCIWRTGDIGSANPAWKDISAGLSGYSYGFATDIEVNPGNADEIYVSFAMATGSHKVYKGVYNSESFSISWFDYSQGLPDLIPGWEIKYDKNTDILYLATDVGVFTRDASISTSQWEPFNSGLPFKLTTDLEINYCAGKIRAATQGRGIWESPLKAKEVTASGTWNTSRDLSSGLIIRQGATLTVASTCTLKVFKDKKLIVEPGAKLIVDGGKITNNTTCGSNMWNGIEVWGNGSLSQTPETNQGVLELKNGATIENSLYGVRVIKTNSYPSNFDWSSTGGIIRAENANFINNRDGIWIGGYKTTLSNGYIVPNSSYIRHCLFENNNTLVVTTEKPTFCIALVGVDGISIQGNTFRNTNPNLASNNYTDRGSGIVIYDASCFITDLCLSNTTPCINVIHNTFNKLNYAINVHPAADTRTVTIDGCRLTDNYNGIWLKGIKNPVITSNNINIKRNGMYLDQCTGFKVEGNDFYSTISGDYGCVIRASGTATNVFYRNRFYALKYGIQLQKYIPGGISNTGLQIKCNNFKPVGFSGCSLGDIAVTTGTFANQGICGTMQSAANNLFTYSNYNGRKDIITNSGVPMFTYNYYPGTSTEHTAPLSYGASVTLNNCGLYQTQAFSYNTACPSTFGLSPDPIELTAKINNSASQINILSSKVDGGSTQNLLNKINSNMSAGNLKNALLAPGPYLSDVVLIATINRSNPLPPGILKEIIVPNSPVTTNVMTVLNTKNLPAGIKADIQAVQTGISARTILEQQIVDLQQQKEIATAELTRYYVNDTLIKLDSLILFLNTQSDLNSKKQLIQAYLLKGDCANATTLLNTLPQQTEEDITYKNYLTLMISLCEQNKNVFQLTESQKQTITEISNSNSSSSIYAQNVLELVSGVPYTLLFDDIEVPVTQLIRGNLYNNPSCNNNPVQGDTIILLDTMLNEVAISSTIITDANGYFKFTNSDQVFLDQTAKYTFGTKSVAVIQDTIFKTIQQWIATSPINLNLKKLTAGFVNDTVDCFNDSVHFTNKTMYGKKPYAFNWSFAFHAVSSQENPVYKYNAEGTYNVSLISTDAFGCTDTLQKQIIIPACPLIFGTLAENSDCGGNPVVNDTIIFTDEYDNIIANAPIVITNANGYFNFDLQLLQNLDTAGLYKLSTKSGYALKDINAQTINQWKAQSPLSLSLQNVRHEWTKFYSDIDSLGSNALQVDLHGNIYVSGSVNTLTSTSDIFLTKYSPIGETIWQVTYDGGISKSEGLSDMVIASDGSIFICGQSIDSDENHISLILKYDSSGNLQWENKFKPVEFSQNYSNAITVDSLGNTYVTGTSFDMIRGYGLTYKCSNTGLIEWYRISSTTATSTDYGNRIRIDTENNVVVYGTGKDVDLDMNNQYFLSLLKYDNNGNQMFKTTFDYKNVSIKGGGWLYTTNNDYYFASYYNDGSSQILVNKINDIGQKIWDKLLMINYSSFSLSQSMSKDNNENILIPYATGVGLGYIKIDTAGNIVTDQLFSTGKTSYVNSVASDVNNNIYIIGFYATSTSVKSFDAICLKYNNNGDFQWNKNYSRGYGQSTRWNDLAVSDNNNVYVTGFSYNGQILISTTIKYSQCPSTYNLLRYNNPITQIPGITSTTEPVEQELETLALRSIEGYEYVNMFPNPNDGNFYFNYSLPENLTCRFAVLDQLGKKVYDIEIKSGRNTIFINSNDFSNGIYYFQVTAGKRLVKTEKLVITK